MCKDNFFWHLWNSFFKEAPWEDLLYSIILYFRERALGKNKLEASNQGTWNCVRYTVAWCEWSGLAWPCYILKEIEQRGRVQPIAKTVIQNRFEICSLETFILLKEKEIKKHTYSCIHLSLAKFFEIFQTCPCFLFWLLSIIFY